MSVVLLIVVSIHHPGLLERPGRRGAGWCRIVRPKRVV